MERKTSRRPCLQLGRPFPLLHHGVYERPNPMPDPNPTIIAMLEYDGGLAYEADAGGGSGEDDRAGFKGGGLGEESDSLTDVEDLVSVRGEGNEYARGRDVETRDRGHTLYYRSGASCR